MLRCIHGVRGGMLTFRWSAYGVDATLHTWGAGGHVNVQVKCIRCRCYVAYMGCGGACQRSGEVHTVSMLRCIHGVRGGMSTFRWSAYGVDATLHTWGAGGHVNVQVKCIRCRCYVAYMGCGGACQRSGEVHTVSMLRCIHGVRGGMSTFRWSAYGVDATLHTWGAGGHVNVQVKCIRCRCYVAYMGCGGACQRSGEVHTVSMLRCIHGVRGGMSTFRWSAYGVDATLHTWGAGGHVNVQVKCIRCRCYVAYMGCGGACQRSGKSFGRKGVRGSLKIASHFEYSTVVPGCHALALAALCMDVVLETQDLEWRIRCFRKFRSFDVQSEWRLGLLEITTRRQARSEKKGA